jgi:hypothetical protein
MTRRTVVTIAVVAIPGLLTALQSRPNFDGRWVAVEPATAAGHELVIHQDASTLRLEQRRQISRETYDSLGRRVDLAGVRESTSYRIDGTALITGSAGQSVRSTLRQESHAFVLRDTYQELHLKFERRLSFDDRGRLILEYLQMPSTNDASNAAETVLDIRRIVFERR